MVGLRLEDNDAALENCGKALELDARSEKALFRRGEALLTAREYERARDDFQRVVQLYPANRAARAQAGVCVKHIREQREKDKRLYGRMFHKLSEAEAEDEEAAGKPGKSVEVVEEEGKKEGEGKKEVEVVSMEVENAGGADEVEKKSSISVEGEKAA